MVVAVENNRQSGARRSPALVLPVGKKSTLTVAGALAAATVALVLALREDAAPDIRPPPVVQGDAFESPRLKRSTFPAPPPDAKAPPPPAEDHGRSLCDGCLPEQAVLDVVETYLRHLDPVYLQGEMWAQPLSDVATPRDRPRPERLVSLPKLSPDLLGAPEHNPFGMSVDTWAYPLDSTWLVWVQTGWVRRRVIEDMVGVNRRGTVIMVSSEEADALAAGEVTIGELRPGVKLGPDLQVGIGLPEVALSWPPIKEEQYIAVDSRTGELRPDGIFQWTSGGVWPQYPPYYESVLAAARERADDWFRRGGSQLGSF